MSIISMGYNHFCQELADMTGRPVRMNLDRRIIISVSRLLMDNGILRRTLWVVIDLLCT
jgi:chemotaxis protein CheY-P-specific phosphatase CheC